MSARRRWCIAAAMTVALFTSGCAGDDDASDTATTPDRGADDGADTDADVGATTAPHDREDGEVAADPDTGAPQAADEEQAPVLSVMTTVAPITDLVRMVGGDRVEVAPLVPPGADSHTYEPRPRDVARLAEADAYLGVGLDLNPGAVRLAEENLPAGAPVVLLAEVALARDEIIFDHSHDDDGHSHSHDDDGHSHADGELGPNAHVWTSLRNATALVEAIADTLSELDPDGAESYRDNAAAAQADLDELDRLIGDAAATIPAANRTLVTYHDAWSYFARDHRLEFATAVQPADLSEPSAAEVRAVIDLIRERDVPAVFGSEVFPTPVLETIAEETGAVHVGNLADDELPGDPGDPDHTYIEMMRRNAITIVAGLGGDTSRLGG